MLILGLETSCDESASAILKISRKKITVLSNIISSQIDIHARYGGVIPEVAAREHVLNIIPVIKDSLEKAKIKPQQLDAIAVTKGPGLITSLIAGMESARSLAYAWKKPLIGINHIEGHIYSAFIDSSQTINFPAIVLTVSGGHTLLALMTDHGKIKIIGETRDDAAGEAYDKGAKMLGLGYPGGPAISKTAAEYQARHKGQAKESLNFPRPMINSSNFDFSFSGLKTSLLYKLKADYSWKKKIPQYCFEYQEAILDILINKSLKAVKKYQAKTLIVSGGVSANSQLRQKLTLKMAEEKTAANLVFPNLAYTTDNAAMIAMAAYYHLISKTPPQKAWQKEKVQLNLSL